MPPESVSTLVSLTDRTPTITGAEIVTQLVPPRQFADASLENYRPDPDFASQAEAIAAVTAFGGAGADAPRRGLFRKKPAAPAVRPGLYLDGGFGVGKTHLLAALWNRTPGRRYFGTFIEYTALVGAVGYAGAASQLKGAALVCIDEFELDDPGDTMMMTRLLGDLADDGTRIAATSNTPPNALGEGRFAAADFLREIQGLSDKFLTLRIDGNDYRRREVEARAHVADDVDAAAASLGGTVSLDDFDGVVAHLATVHPSKYVKLVDDLDAVGLRDVHVLTSQVDALRLVAFVDRLYDAQIRVVASGTPLDQVFSDEMLAGGYRKKYLRAVSRLVALTSL
ncbi:cell division protein ZapE [Frigoribacterium sp. CFBP 8751]|uniref:cell division protein ZapE n=1 Tax=Frigoribacterium sp. CFBP 8751 TaxID=2775277 RepID=UPI00177BA054|nr:cell division protein ZapE [Frigoribacterium sp. CFBP 8751]MBD8539305.1 cell division protein ZapE [Frigoribacterium sp. CFBP 8751]